MKKILLTILILAMLVFSGCSSEEPEIENIVDQITEDGDGSEVISEKDEIQPVTEVEETNETEEKEETVTEEDDFELPELPADLELDNETNTTTVETEETEEVEETSNSDIDVGLQAEINRRLERIEELENNLQLPTIDLDKDFAVDDELDNLYELLDDTFEYKVESKVFDD